MTAQEARKKVEENIKFLKKEKLLLKDLEDAEQSAKADSVIALFDSKLEKAVSDNKFQFTLERLAYSDYASRPPYNEMWLDRCKPWVRLVFNKISKMEGFKAELAYGHNGCGESWFDIVVSF